MATFGAVHAELNINPHGRGLGVSMGDIPKDQESIHCATPTT